MKIVKFIYVLYKIQLLSPIGIYSLFSSIYSSGINLMTLLHIAGKKYGNNIALIDDRETITYQRLLAESINLAHCLKQKTHLHSGQKVGFLCRNHVSLVKSIFAVSRLGANVYLLNTEMSKNQLNQFVARHDFDLIIYDEELSELLEQSHYSKKKVLSYHDRLPAINNLQLESYALPAIPRTYGSKIVLQTSGTTGISKDAAHKPSLFNYLHPFIAFIKRLRILKYHSAYIATPIYHGYGLAVLLLFIPLGKTVVVSCGFNAKKACNLVHEHQVEVVTVVPSMLQKMLESDAEKLASLRCVASGGAKLHTKLVNQTFMILGRVLYNLYGTSEAGLNFIATPQDLEYSPLTVGKKIKGMRVKFLDRDMNELNNGKIGQLCIQNDWSIKNRNKSWIQTGDLGYQDENGYYFLCGRTDDMVVSGGENVYPIEVEQVLMEHTLIEDVAIIGVQDDLFGQRLQAYVLPKENQNLTEKELLEWLRPRVARFQLPKEIKIVNSLPYTSLGKLNKKQLISVNMGKEAKM
ncbi:AMP-binding protein [Bacillus pinisoli]|uniref:AMP-binding protein n=1 Tax=Bacillus pinisoli TaxID=2901866 RepID=UPI001FF6C405|nr:AMP-binding protein [Bacillus pinisoli]